MNFTKDELAVLTIDMINGLSLGKKHKILELFESPSDMFEGFDFDQIDFLKSDMIKKIEIAFSPLSQKIMCEQIESLPCEVITIASFDYPSTLKEIYQPPLCIYYRCNIKLLQGEIVTFTGTRHSTIYGKDVTEKFLSKLIEKNVLIACGVSDGIDRNVMECICDEEGTAVLITAGGIDKIVPSINKDIANKCAKCGLILSEHKPDVSPQKYHYALRNRIFAGLSQVVVIAEAESASSSLEIASGALEYGREVFAVPGSVLSNSSRGANAIIAKGYAQALIDDKQIFDVLRLEYNFASQTKTISVDEVEEEIIGLIEKGVNNTSEIAQTLNLAPHILLSKLMMLEAKGIISNIGGNRYTKRNF